MSEFIPRSNSLSRIVQGIGPATVIDVGAMLLNEEGVFCRRLVDAGLARLITFEPDITERQKLVAALGPRHECLPYFIADGTERTFYQTNMAMTGSLYRPNRAVVDSYNNLGEAMQVVATHQVQTFRLDAVVGDRDPDLLKMDVQGAELDILRGSERTLQAVTIVQAEVSFVEMYEGQCLFADVDSFLRGLGFVFHTFRGIAGRALKPTVIGGNPNRPVNQFLWTDAVYLRDCMRLDRLSTDKLLRMALLLHDEYGSVDFCHRVLGEVDQRQGTSYQASYGEMLEQA